MASATSCNAGRTAAQPTRRHVPSSSRRIHTSRRASGLRQPWRSCPAAASTSSRSSRCRVCCDPRPSIRRTMPRCARRCRPRASATRRDGLSLAHTLDFLWREARLHEPGQGPRGWREVHNALTTALAKGELARHPMNLLVYAVPPFVRSHADEHAPPCGEFVRQRRRAEAWRSNVTNIAAAASPPLHLWLAPSPRTPPFPLTFAPRLARPGTAVPSKPGDARYEDGTRQG